MRCRYCHNPELVMQNSKTPVVGNDEAIAFVEKRKGLLDGIAITGGEPTLSKNLIPFLRSLRSTGVSIKLDTNGLQPGIIEAVLENKLVDYIALDIKTSPEKYGDLTGRDDAFPYIRKTLAAVKIADIDYEIRTTCIPGYVEFEDIKKIAREIGFVKRYYLQQFVADKTLDASLANVRPFQRSVLESYCTYLKGFAEVCAIRGL